MRGRRENWTTLGAQKQHWLLESPHKKAGNLKYLKDLRPPSMREFVAAKIKIDEGLARYKNAVFNENLSKPHQLKFG